MNESNPRPEPDPSLAPGDAAKFEALLASLAPNPDRLDRDRLMFRAGQASVSAGAAPRRAGWAWPTAFAGMTAAAAALLVALVVRGPTAPPAGGAPTSIAARTPKAAPDAAPALAALHSEVLTVHESLHDVDRLLAGDFGASRGRDAFDADLPASPRVLDTRSLGDAIREGRPPGASL
jgi:hypothetical protein